MFTRNSALALCALIGLMGPRTATAQDWPIATSGQTWSRPQLAQYGGAPFDGPPDVRGYGPPPGFDGPQPGYRGGMSGDDGADGGYEPRRSSSRSRGVARITYHGFRIDLSEAGGSHNLTRTVASIEHQIDLVDSVGLGVSDLGAFRQLPIKVTAGQEGGGHYSGGSVVTMGALSISDRRPVLLHEYMHVYHHSRLPGGFQNPDIRAFYEEAVGRGLYPSGSYMLKNPGEFFAMTASCYLYGTVARPPNSRDTIRERQPDYYAYLVHLFGPPHGTHSAGTGRPRSGSGEGGAASMGQDAPS